MKHHYHLTTHKLIADLPVDIITDPNKDILVKFAPRPSKIDPPPPHPYGLCASFLYVSEKKKRFYADRKQAFFSQIDRCWVRSFEETDDRYIVTLW